MRAFVLYSISFLVLAFYSGQVCPFMAQLGVWGMLRLTAVLAAGVLGTRIFLLKTFGFHEFRPGQARVQFYLDFALFIAAGTALTAYNYVVHHFPVQSGLAFTIGAVTLGAATALDLSLEREYRIVKEMIRTGKKFDLAEGRGSIARKFTFGAAAGMFLITFVIVLMIGKSLWDATNLQGMIDSVVFSNLTRNVVVLAAVILVYLLNIIVSFGRNLKAYFESETSVLDRVSAGDLDAYVAVASDDEFGRIAVRTNHMIDGLKDRERIRGVFGKVVSPEIAKTLLDRDGHGSKMGGSRRSLVFLMSDIRGFTEFSEKAAPEEVVETLNLYFSSMVEIVRRNGGLVDKFIGDGMLAVFGFTPGGDAAGQAVRAASEMVRALPDLKLKHPVQIGIGIHSGDAVAGTIGSPERLEYTFIGDTVNTAARLESLTKNLGAPIAVSEPVRRACGDGYQWSDFGSQTVKGKQEPIHVYGLLPAG